MNKKIFFSVDGTTFMDFIRGEIYNAVFRQYGEGYAIGCFDYYETERALHQGYSYLVTLSMAHFSFDLYRNGYEIYLCYKDKQIKIEPHMDLGDGSNKDIKPTNNLLKLFLAGTFDKLLGIEYKK